MGSVLFPLRSGQALVLWGTLEVGSCADQTGLRDQSTERARSGNGQAAHAIGQRRGLSADQAGTVEAAACAAGHRSTRSACFLPRLEGAGYPQAESFMKSNMLGATIKSRYKLIDEIES